MKVGIGYRDLPESIRIVVNQWPTALRKMRNV